MANICDLKINVNGESESLDRLKRLYIDSNKLLTREKVLSTLPALKQISAFVDVDNPEKRTSLESVFSGSFFELELKEISSSEYVLEGWSKWDPPIFPLQWISQATGVNIYGTFSEECNTCGWFTFESGKRVDGARLGNDLYYPAMLHLYGESCLRETIEMQELNKREKREFLTSLKKGIHLWNSNYPTKNLVMPAL
jgi:hypothetical protein